MRGVSNKHCLLTFFIVPCSDTLVVFPPIFQIVPKTYQCLNLKAPITTAADGKFCSIFPKFWKKNKVWYFMRIVWRFSRNIMPYLLFLKKWQNLKLSSAANYRWRFKVKISLVSSWIRQLMYKKCIKFIIKQADPYDKTGDAMKGDCGCKIWLPQNI